MPPKSHVHKYKYINLGTKEKPRKVYACSLPDCTHHMLSLSQVLGKESICWKCGDEMIMSADIIAKRKVKPKCYKCRSSSKNPPTEEKKKEALKLDDAFEMLSAMRGLK